MSPRPVAVVGTGVAGLCTALSISGRPVFLIGRLPHGADCATALAQGGIAAAMAEDDTPADHARDTLQAGCGHNDYDTVRYLTDHAVTAIRWLQMQGVDFDRYGARLALGREGGHDRARVVHAGGDASGAALLAALTRTALNALHIHWRTPCELDALLLRGGRIAGVRIRGVDGHEEAIETAEVVLATGGIGALFSATTNPVGADGNGLALAMAAGAGTRDLEFVQFHPTALSVPGAHRLPLITEALRGAGARLLDGRDRPLMEGVHPLRDLAPRDVVSRQVWSVLRNGGTAWLDARHLPVDWSGQFPTVLAICREHGIDPRADRIPVTPAAHFHMGGVAVDAAGRTAIEGLHAVGEVACNGVHGANRLASNSLLEGVVFGRRLGRQLSELRLPLPGSGAHRWVRRDPSADAADLAALREISWQALGPVRDERTMRSALRQLQDGSSIAPHWQTGLIRKMLEAALNRRQSLGAHFRQDALAA